MGRHLLNTETPGPIGTAPADPSSTRTRHDSNRDVGAPVFTPAVNLPHEAALIDLVNKNSRSPNSPRLAGGPLPSPLVNFDQGVNGPEDDHVEVTEVLDEALVGYDDIVIRKAVSSNPGFEPSTSEIPATETSESQLAHTSNRDPIEHHVASQALQRGPTKKALLITADSSPAINNSEHIDQLDFSVNDSERFKQSLKSSANGKDVYINVLENDGSITRVGNRIFVEFMSTKLDGVRCTVEVVLDICHAAGLIKCQHVTRQMKPNIVASFPLIPNPRFVITGQHDQNKTYLPARRVDLGIQYSTMETSSRSTHGSNSTVQALSLGNLMTSNVFVWAAAKAGETAYERTNGCSNGTLVDGFCTAIETKGYLSRRELFDHYVSTTIEEENVAFAEKVAQRPVEEQKQLMREFKPQHAQLLSNRNNT
ncbi:hypothetical protein FRC09_001145, partial [Ceratobasidium sp. 395]